MKSNAIICIFTIIIIFHGCDSTKDSTGVYNSNKVSGCTNITACNYDGDATIDDNSCIYYIDVCGKCGGNTIITEECPIIWNIYYNISQNIGGFQFNVNGVTVINASGGVAEESGFSVTATHPIVLGFSFSANIILAGSGILTQIEYEGDIANACITDLVLSDIAGDSINAEIVDCNTIKYPN